MGRLGRSEQRGKGEMLAEKEGQQALWAGPRRGSVDTHQAPTPPAHPRLLSGVNPAMRI